jgi:hypothetical protein
MLDQLIATVSAKTGLSPDKAHAAVDAVVSQLKSKLPAPVASHIDEVLAGNFQGSIADAEAKLKEQFANVKLADAQHALDNAKGMLANASSAIGQILHRG